MRLWQLSTLAASLLLSFGLSAVIKKLLFFELH